MSNEKYPVTGDPTLLEKFPQREPWDVPDDPPTLEEECTALVAPLVARGYFGEDEKKPSDASVNRVLLAMGYTRQQIGRMPENYKRGVFDNEVNKLQARIGAYPQPTTSAELASTVYPPLRWTVDKLIREGIPQTIDGDGGIGKSTVMVGTAVAIGAGEPIFGKPTIAGPVLFVTHEDDLADLQATARAYADYLGVDLAALPVEWWSLLEHDITLATVAEDGTWKEGPFYDAFESRLRASPRGLFVVLDCRSDVVQMNEVLREPPNTFYKTVLMPLCKRHGCTIIVLCHPSKAAMNDGSYYSGGTGNKSALRNKLVMKLADDSAGADPLGPRVLDVLKRNRGARDKTGVRLSFDVERGIFVADDDAAVRRETAKQYGVVIEQIKGMLAAGVVVQVGNTGSGQGPREVAAALAKAGTRISEKETKSVMKAAIRDGLLGYHGAKPGGRVAAGFHLIEDPLFGAEVGE